MPKNIKKRRVFRWPSSWRRRRKSTVKAQRLKSAGATPIDWMAHDHSEAAMAEEALLIATVRAGPYAHADKVNPDIGASDPLNPWSIAKRREWFVNACAAKLQKVASVAKRKKKDRFEVSLTVAHPRGLVEVEELSPAHFESRRRFHERIIPKIPGAPYLMGYIDATLNQDTDGSLKWQLHEHVVISLRASSQRDAVDLVRAAYRINDKGPILRPVMVRDVPTPAGFLTYASKTSQLRNLRRRVGYLGRDELLRQNAQPVKRKYLLMWSKVVERLKPCDRMIFVGVRRDGIRLNVTKRKPTGGR